LERGIVKGSNGVVFNRFTLLVIACVLSFIAGAAYTKAGRPITMLSTTVTETQADSQSQMNESDVKTEPIQSAALALPSKPEEQKAEAKSNSSDEWRIVKMRVTGYCPCPKCCGKSADGITANGHKIRPGDTFVAADKRYSFGTEMVIEGYNNGQTIKVLDRGGAIRGNKLDAFFHTHQEALEWGVRHIDVKVRDK
jgi:3D (Asp-Asp-Asp) domain-containing protein